MPLEAASGLWRSEDMVVLQLHMQREAAHDSVLQLGRVGMVQFVDLNSSINAFQRDFAGDVRRCDDMERKLRFITEEITKAGVRRVQTRPEPEPLNTLERKIDEKEVELRELISQLEALANESNRTREHLEILTRDLGYATDPSYGGLTLLAGVIPKDKLMLVQRLIYRTTRGNSILRTDDIERPFFNISTGESTSKCVIGVFFSAPRIADKLKKICEVNGATLYPYAQGREQLITMRQALRQQGDSLNQTLQQTRSRRDTVLGEFVSNAAEWRRVVATEKAVFSIMNLLQFKGATVIARGWVPLSEVDNVKEALSEAEVTSGAQVATIVEELHTTEKRPTFFKTNKITSVFQGIVDSYGVARYKEVNPGVFTIVTFPYLFGVMYGDIGHGLILTIFAAFLIFMEKNWEGKPLNEMFAMIFGGRYLLFAMGLFATYVGVLYNDMFGFSTEIFTSAYKWPQLSTEHMGIIHPTFPNGKPSVKPLISVDFGIDSAWSETTNKLEFYNSVKMKCAVIIGIVQMSVGVILSLLNHLYFNDWMHVWFRFVPEIVFLSFTFGYMAILIILKWCTTWTNTHDAPSLLETMTNFFLQPGVVKQPLFQGQATLQTFLLLIAFSMIPVMLLVIPYLEKRHHDEKVKIKLRSHLIDDDDEEEEHFDFSEIMIHQIIHTIEYVLGCVSNTASYLRLWALSLAHAQLSDVFWNFAFMMTVGLDDGSGILVFIGFAVWMSATIGILLGMESLSAFLHSLRLHWVEFQNKFYYGDGIAFVPFDIADVLRIASR